MSKKTSKEQEKIVIDALASGKSTRDASKAAVVSQTTVMRIAEKKQDEIEKQTRRLIKTMPDIISSIARDLKTSELISKICAGKKEMGDMPRLLMADKSILTKFMDLTYKMKTDVLRAIGVFPSQSRSIFIENLIAEGGKAIINPKVLNIVGKHLTDSLKPPALETELEKEEDKQ